MRTLRKAALCPALAERVVQDLVTEKSTLSALDDLKWDSVQCWSLSIWQLIDGLGLLLKVGVIYSALLLVLERCIFSRISPTALEEQDEEQEEKKQKQKKKRKKRKEEMKEEKERQR